MSNAGKSVGSTYSVYFVAFLAILFFRTSDLAIRPFPSYCVQWIVAVFLICLIIFVYAIRHDSEPKAVGMIALMNAISESQ